MVLLLGSHTDNCLWIEGAFLIDFELILDAFEHSWRHFCRWRVLLSWTRLPSRRHMHADHPLVFIRSCPTVRMV